MNASQLSLPEAIAQLERAMIVRALTDQRGNQCVAAAALGISRNALHFKMEKHNLRPADYRRPGRNRTRYVRRPAQSAGTAPAVQASA